MKVSVIIGSYRPGICLHRCLESLGNQTIPPDEIIIGIDTAQNDLTGVISIEDKNIPYKYIASNKTGVSAARNSACEYAIGDIFAFIDDDAIAETNWIELIHKKFNDEKISCIGGPVIPIFEGRPIPEQWYWIVGCTGMSERPIGANMAIRKFDFNTYKGFSEDLGRKKYNLAIGEETEMILNLEKDHKNVVWDPEMIVYHKCPESRTQWAYIISRSYKEGLGKAIINKHHVLLQEQKFLKYYLIHPDKYTIPVLLSTGIGFIKGHIGQLFNNKTQSLNN